MTFPCIDPEHFEVVGDDLTPQEYMQWRHVATNTAPSIQNEYLVSGGNQAEDLLELQVSWTNPDPVGMNVYGLLTRGGSIVTNNPRNQVYLETYWGATQGVAPVDPVASTLVGRFGNGASLGLVGGTETIFTNFQTRQGERTSVLGSTVVLATGESYKLRIRLRWDAQFWETLPVINSGAETELSVVTGESRLDLFAYPVIV